MYQCQFCGKFVPPGTPCHRLVVETRRTQFPFRVKANAIYRDGKKEPKYIDDPGGIGAQIVREMNACPVCAIRLEGPRGG